MDFERLSSNVINVINEILSNQNIVNYVGHNGNNPSLANVIPSTIAPMSTNEKIVPFPFDSSFKDDVRTQIHVYYPDIDLTNNANVGRATMLIDIVVHRNIWLLVDNGTKYIRPYQIAKFIFDTFGTKEGVKGVGKMNFLQCVQVNVNEEFECFRMVANITEF